MKAESRQGWHQRREAKGFLVSVVFVCLAAARDVYLGGLFQQVSLLLVATLAFSLSTFVFLPVALMHSRENVRSLLRRPLDLVWVNLTSAVAWLSFLAALRLIEPALVQILYSGIGPLSVVWIDRYFVGASSAMPLTSTERPLYLALLGSLLFASAVALLGLSGTGAQPLGAVAFGVLLAAGGGISISVSTMLCRRLNDAGITPSTVLSLRYPATALAAAVLTSLSPTGPAGTLPTKVDMLLVIAALLIVIPSYVNQVGISLASPLTVRVVLATAPVLIFFVQLVEGRLTASPYSLTAALFYALCAILAGVARQRAIRSAVSQA